VELDSSKKLIRILPDNFRCLTKHTVPVINASSLFCSIKLMKKHTSEKEQMSRELVDEIGGRITTIRLSYGLKQAEFCDMIGISKGNLSDLENNRYKPSYQAIVKIIDNFKVNPHWLLSGKGDIFENEPVRGESDEFADFAAVFRLCDNSKSIMQDIKVIKGINESALKEVKDYVRFKLKTEIKKKERRTVVRRSHYSSAVPGGIERRSGEDRRKTLVLAWQ